MVAQKRVCAWDILGWLIGSKGVQRAEQLPVSCHTFSSQNVETSGERRKPSRNGIGRKGEIRVGWGISSTICSLLHYEYVFFFVFFGGFFFGWKTGIDS